ncbi:hypothetical protein ABZW32_24160 [Streptomyces sp. NPDC004667]|uniref:hypothetical protein n=1 Tax=Streptomyces sp. NPDC004667 TaxID=3154285 RepID=UPI0033AC2B18
MTRGRTGLIIGGAFGLAFIAVNAGAVAPLTVPLRLLAIAAFVGLFFASRPPAAGTGAVATARTEPTAATAPAARPAFGRRYWLVVAAEVVAGLAGVFLTARVFHAPHLAVACIALVVGVHFFALAAVWRQASLHVLGATMTACGAAGLLLGAAGAGTAAVSAVAGIAPGVLLLASAWWSALAARRPRAAL